MTTKALRNLCVLMTIWLLPLAATAQTTYYVTADATGDGSSWDNPMTLANALTKAQAQDQIWVKAGTYAGSFTLQSGVSLYGGFEGTESSIEQRAIDGDKAYRMTHQTILSGDVNGNDTIDGVNLIFPANQSRNNNATHVLTIDLTPSQQSGNNNTTPTIVDGITIKGGHADQANEQGGGILVMGNNSEGGVYIIRRCFFIENYATRGGALYVTNEVGNPANKCLIDRCGFFNNAAGERGVSENQGGAIYLAGAGTVVNCAVFNNENGGIYLGNSNAKVINSTVTRNTGSGIDGDKKEVSNTVIWGNATLSSSDNRPTFSHCAYPEATPGGTDSNGNVYLAAKNNEENGPHFSSPSLKTGFDTDFTLSPSNRYPLWTWEPMEATPLVDSGYNGTYNVTDYENLDLNGDPRIQNGTIDIGAFEYQPIEASRVRYVKRDGTGNGTSWENASGDLQRMIDELADNNPQGLPGEVWVTDGFYEPQSQLIQGTGYSASFRMRDGISVYGGFAGTESSKTERKRKEGGMPWEFANQTILQAAYYIRNESNPSFTDNSHKWTLTSDSRHVVWFAPMPGEEAFTQPTYLDGVTITGGYAQGGTGLEDFKTDRGAGVYMDGRNAYLTNSIVKENYATGNGGGVYLKDGRVQSSLIYNNNADQNGGAVYVDDQGLVLRSMLTNNSAHNGAGVYLDNQPATSGEEDHPEYLILSTCVVSNNTASGNGSVYCDEGGVLLQNTITNNACVTGTDATDPNASQTGGIYINKYALVVNSVIWNNRMNDGTNIPMYAKNPTTQTVRFRYNAISGVNNAVWNNTLQEQTLSLVDENEGITEDPNSIGPRFDETTLPQNFNINTSFGVQDAWRDAKEEAGVITYFWKPINGSNLWARGMALGQLPSEVVIAPEIDIEGSLFAQKPAVGAFHVEKSNIVPALEASGNNYKLVLYVDVDCTEPDHDGSSWATAYRSLNDAIAFFAELTNQSSITIYSNGEKEENWSGVGDITGFEIRVLEGDLWPRYAFVNEDPKTATLDILAMQSVKSLKIVGGYYRNEGSNDDVQRDPLNHRSQLNGIPDGNKLDDGLYHVVTVESNAKVELDGFHVINGYAAGTATLQYGAGLLAHPNANVTLTNCIFENNTAVTGAAIYAQGATLTLQNCVVNNNTNTTEANPVIVASDPTLLHVTIVNNKGAAPENMGDTSFSAGNTSGKNSLDIETIGATGAVNFANPTNQAGATLGFNTYLGGYTSFRPLTSSADAGNSIINKVSAESTNLTTDITAINDRNLGGVPDRGAYEANLPKAGEILYVRADGDDSNNGLSWDNAFNTLDKALDVAEQSQTVKEIWVAAGTYTGQIKGSRNNVNAGNNIHRQAYAYEMIEGINVYGGFPASGTPGEDERDPSAYETILQAQDTPTEYPTTDRESQDLSSVGRVLVQRNHFNTETVWDGFVIRNGFLNTGYRYTIQGNIMNLNTEIIGEAGGAGVYLMGNGVLENCRIEGNRILADKRNIISDNGGIHAVGAGVYCIGGTIRNCQILDNEVRVYSQQQNSNGAAFAYGGGLYILNHEEGGNILHNAAIFNTIIANNRAQALVRGEGKAVFHTTALGAGACQISGNFYNNTITNNIATTSDANCTNIMCGGMFVYESAEIYNCIIYNNKGIGGRLNEGQYGLSKDRNEQIVAVNLRAGHTNGDDPNNEAYMIYPERIKIYYSNVGRINEDGQPEASKYVEQGGQNGQNGYTERNNTYQSPLFENEENDDYRLGVGSPAINSGTVDIPDGKGGTIEIPDYDADYSNRIKDCGIDMGAFESTNDGNILYTLTTENDQLVGTYYVSQNGAGQRSGENPANAACAMKLQDILTNAGEKVADGTLTSAIVKVAGYENGEFVYHANTLADTNNPQSYTFVVPDGVTMMGGYFEGTFDNGTYQSDGWDDVTTGENVRDAIKFRTVLSATAVPTQGSTITQEVTGYHAVTFGEGDETTALTKGATIDGVWLINGSATSMAGAGNPATRGGGAIVPNGAHVRNCVVQGNTALEGGGLYLMPGATVSGTAILGNKAENGGGIYADNTNVADGVRSHVISCTIADNSADYGGGLYLEEGASMQVNTVIWGNEAASGKNVSGVMSERYPDTRLERVFGSINEQGFYPFNDCFVESQEMPSDLENSSMQSEEEIYFADELRTLKEFSPLIKHGVRNDYYDHATSEDLISVFHAAETDMRGISRVQPAATRADAGAFAFEGGILPTDLFTRIFVSQTKNVKLRDGENMLKYLGKSFYTAFSTLEDALAYVRSMRENGKNSTEKFEILVGSGTYKPIYKREDEDASPTVTNDQRLYSFVVPHGVSIYGGFSGTEKYITPENMQFGDEQVTTIPTENETINSDWSGDISTLPARELSDFNGNGIKEPWELANQTILSGNINVSAEVGNVYHVLYTNANGTANPSPVLLDGLTVMDGETFDELSDVEDNDEAGRGGGLYSNGVAYTINRCRFMNNLGIRGGAVYVRDARLNVIGSIFAGNGWTGPAKTPENQPARGGAIFMGAKNETSTSLYAVNSLFVNNETIGDGGAIGTTYAEGVTSHVDPNINIMNCTFAKNKAKNNNAVLYNHNGKSHLTNTLIWGNESETYDDQTDVAETMISHSASDHDYKGQFSAENGTNVLLGEENTAANGPRFTRPSATAGIAGNDATNLWNPSGISVATDKGDGVIKVGATTAEGAYADWFAEPLDIYKDQYMEDGYERYSGPLDETTGKTGDKPIDIGVYEYQYISNFQTMPAIYVATEESGDHSGRDWANATSDLRGAIVGASHPMSNDGPRTIYVRDGEYSLERLSGGTAFTASVNTNQWSNGLTIKGSCTGIGLREDAQQDFAKQSVIRNHEGTSTTNLMAVHVNDEQYVRIEGFTFINGSAGGTGIEASTSDANSTFTLANSALRMNQTGVNISANSGSVLIYNTLFADGGTGLDVQSGQGDNITLVNNTFANNTTADMSTGLSNVFNSVSWNNKTQNIPTGEEKNNRGITFTGDAAANNEDIQKGPNFIDPVNGEVEARDYHIRPSLTLLNQGGNGHYVDNVLGGEDKLTDERDLGNSARLTDERIDIGAYEYEAPLQPIVFVREGLTVQDPDGKSWSTALGDLQAAADLAGIYAYNNDDEKSGYVFADYNVDVSDLRLTLPRTKVYGGMDRQEPDTPAYDGDGNATDDVEGVVKELLGKREGLVERGNKSELGNVTISAEKAVVDGFMVTGTPTITAGCLATSIIDNGGKGISGSGKGVLYNSLVYGGVSGVKAVNVTATGDIAGDNGSVNNRTGVTETNTYVTTDHWKYQLMETSGDIDAGTEQDLRPYTDMVGHDRDIAGNKRVRGKVDNGCFETWNITPGMASGNIVTSDDYPHGQSVVYVRKGEELPIEKEYTASAPFNPGVLLLEHQAGLRGNGHNIGLSYVIMERDVPARGADMAYAPFTVTGQPEREGDVSLKRYDGAQRASYDYTYDSENGKAWKDATSYGRTGLLLDNTGGTEAAKVRFVGRGTNNYVYREGPGMNETKTVSLAKYNYMDPWTTTDPGTGNRFTHKENMSWNLFGSPYLCAMNYGDMEYGRVVYGYRDGNYVTVNTAPASGERPSGHIPAGDAVFTQTATLKDSEVFAVTPSTGREGTAYAGTANAEIAITRADGTRAAEAPADETGDVLGLNTTSPGQAREDFDLGADGVKWMADSTAQIYATRGTGRYSLLSAVNVEGTVSVGVTLPAPGAYTIRLAEECPAEGYETVTLEDAATGETVNLLEGGYSFTATAAGDVKGRFSISFNRLADDRLDDGIRAYSPSRALVRVEGVEPGDRISIYRADGIMAGQDVAASSVADIPANASAVAIVKVERDGKTIAVKKIRVR